MHGLSSLALLYLATAVALQHRPAACRLIGIASVLKRGGAHFALEMAAPHIFKETAMTWTELLVQAADSGERARLVLDSALAAASAASNTALDAEMAASLLTASGLCAVLDAYGVRVPGPVAARVTWYSVPKQAPVAQAESAPQAFHPAKHLAF